MTRGFDTTRTARYLGRRIHCSASAETSLDCSPPAAKNTDQSGGSRTSKELLLTKVTVRDGETVDRAIKRFKRKVEQAGILKEVRKREHYLKPSVKAKLKARAAEARARKREKRLLLNGV